MNKITKERVRQLADLKKEVEKLEITYDKMWPDRYEQVSDTYKDYRTGYPVVKSVTGLSRERFTKLENRLEEQRLQLESDLDGFEDLMEQISEGKTRMILRLLFIDGYTQEKTAEIAGCSSKTAQRKKVWFFENFF